jgi:hypothetical protein
MAYSQERKMTKISIVGILPVAMRAAGNALGTALGWQPPSGDTFNMAASSDGLTATHYGFRVNVDVAGEFMSALANPPPEAAPILAAMILDQSTTLYGAEHFNTVCSANGLTRFYPSE